MCSTVLQIEEDTFSKILKIFEKTQKSANDDIVILKEWMRSQPHLPEIMADEKIRNFLILNKFSIENAKKKIDAYYTMRSIKFELLINPKVKEIKEAMDTLCWLPSAIMTKEMYRIHWFKVINLSKIDTLNPLFVFGAFYNFKEIALMEDFMLADVYIIDMTGIPFSVMQKGLTLLPKSLILFEKVYSSRLKEVHCINCPSYFPTVMSIAKTLMKAKIYERIKVYTDDKILHQRFSKDLIPKDYGGEGQSLYSLTEKWKLKLDQNQILFDQLEQLSINEKLRPKQLINDEILGYHGNFKHLDLD